MMVEDHGYEDQSTDELVYAKCRLCAQLEELNDDDLCFICEGLERKSDSSKNGNSVT